MYKKAVSLFTLVLFTVFTFSCSYTTKSAKMEDVKTWKNKDIRIEAVFTKSGETIEFAKGEDGRIVGDKIVGKVLDERGLKKHISVPIADVESVWVKKIDAGKTFFTVMGIGLVVAGVGFLLYMLTKESCPFVYSFDGEQYVFDAEPYGGAICPGLKRVEWCGLEHLREVDGDYRLLLTNEVDETQYTDELELWVVDHPHEVQVAPGILGRMHTIAEPVVPVRAYDQDGRDLTRYVCENDWLFWQSRNSEKDPARIEQLRDELRFEFPKPRNAGKAKLIFNGCNTLWGSQMLKRYLELYGSRVSAWYDEVKNLGPAFYQMTKTHISEELYALQLKVETDNGWQFKDFILGGGPFVSEDRVYPLDLENVPGDTLRIKLSPPALFWKINYIAVDYSEDVPVQVTKLKAVRAEDHTGRDVGELLSATDNRYLAMPDFGDSAELVFRAPARQPGLQRSFVLKASGYYDIHLKAEGEPQHELLHRIHSEPGFIVQYAIAEYLKWQQELMER